MLAPITQGIFSPNWRKRNSAMLLSAEMLEKVQKEVRISYIRQQMREEQGQGTPESGASNKKGAAAP